MQEVKMQEVLADLNGFFPVTGEDGGNYTQLFLKGGRKLTSPRRTKTLLAELAKVYAKDIVLVKRQAGGILGYSKDLPLLIIPQLVLIPVKVREAGFKDEGTFGYAVLNRIDAVQPAKTGGFKSCVVFNDGSRVPSLNTVQKLRQKLNEALDLIKAEQARVSLVARIEARSVCERVMSYKL